MLGGKPLKIMLQSLASKQWKLFEINSYIWCCRKSPTRETAPRKVLTPACDEPLKLGWHRSPKLSSRQEQGTKSEWSKQHQLSLATKMTAGLCDLYSIKNSDNAKGWQHPSAKDKSFSQNWENTHALHTQNAKLSQTIHDSSGVSVAKCDLLKLNW